MIQHLPGASILMCLDKLILPAQKHSQLQEAPQYNEILKGKNSAIHS